MRGDGGTDFWKTSIDLHWNRGGEENSKVEEYYNIENFSWGILLREMRFVGWKEKQYAISIIWLMFDFYEYNITVWGPTPCDWPVGAGKVEKIVNEKQTVEKNI